MQNHILYQKVAVITGASRGIGREIALAFAREGASLLLICLRDHESLKNVQAEVESLGATTVSMVGDVSSIEFCNLKMPLNILVMLIFL